LYRCKSLTSSRLFRGNETSGIDIVVSFSPGAEAKKLAQLSGGQRAIVALSFILAIQRVDGLPFYVFDEIDGALDPNFRLQVAKLLQQRTETSQFIVITHKPELVELADKHYVVQHRNQVSNIVAIERNEALQIVQEVDGSEEVSSE